MSYRYKKKFPLEPTRKILNNKNDFEFTNADVLNLGNKTTNNPKIIGKKIYDGKRDSDIFNTKGFDEPKVRVNPSNKSDVFNSMKNEDQFSKEIKDYTKTKRVPKQEYDPTPYYPKLTATEQKVQFCYSDHQFL